MNNINWGKVPDELTMEQFYKLCHVSKKTARYLLRSGKITWCNLVNRTLDETKPPLYNECAKEVLL